MAIGRKTGGRKKGSLNKRTHAKMVGEARVVASPQPSAPPIDPLAEWDEIYRQLKALAAREQRRPGPDGTPGGGMDPKAFEGYMQSAAKVLAMSTPYRLPQLKSTEHKFPNIDLSRLTDGQIRVLAAIVDGATAVEGGGEGGDRQTAH